MPKLSASRSKSVRQLIDHPITGNWKPLKPKNLFYQKRATGALFFGRCYRFFGFVKKADVEQHSDRGGTIFRTNFRQKWTTFGTTFRICVFSNKETRFVPNHVRGLPKSLPRSAQIMSEILSQFLPGFA